MRYTHLPQGGDTHSGHGMSAQWSERTIFHKGCDVLYLLTDAVVDTVCCGDRIFHYATVLGYVEDWKKERNEAGLPVSIVNPVVEEGAREEIERLLQDKEPDVQVSFRSDLPG